MKKAMRLLFCTLWLVTAGLGCGGGGASGDKVEELSDEEKAEMGAQAAEAQNASREAALKAARERPGAGSQPRGD